MSGSDLFTGTLDILILQGLTGGRSHGYAIGSWMRERSNDVFDIKEGVLYPALHRLNRKGLVKAVWDRTDTGRRARFYELTPKGRKHLDAERRRLTRHSAAVLGMLQSFPK